MTLPVSLAVVAVTLRESANYRQLVASVSGGGTLHMHMVSDGEIAVADLINGTVKLHILDSEPTGGGDYDIVCRAGCYLTADEECPTVRLLVPLVRAFLPDWNPDTEETP